MFRERLGELYTLCPGYSFGPLSSARSFLSQSDYESLVEITASLATSIYTVTPNNQRGLSAEKLAECVKLHNKNVQAMSSIERAIDNALADGCEAIIIFGSLSFLNEAYKFLGGETID